MNLNSNHFTIWPFSTTSALEAPCSTIQRPGWRRYASGHVGWGRTQLWYHGALVRGAVPSTMAPLARASCVFSCWVTWKLVTRGPTIEVLHLSCCSLLVCGFLSDDEIVSSSPCLATIFPRFFLFIHSSNVYNMLYKTYFFLLLSLLHISMQRCEFCNMLYKT